MPTLQSTRFWKLEWTPPIAGTEEMTMLLIYGTKKERKKNGCWRLHKKSSVTWHYSNKIISLKEFELPYNSVDSPYNHKWTSMIKNANKHNEKIPGHSRQKWNSKDSSQWISSCTTESNVNLSYIHHANAGCGSWMQTCTLPRVEQWFGRVLQ